MICEGSCCSLKKAALVAFAPELGTRRYRAARHNTSHAVDALPSKRQLRDIAPECKANFWTHS